MNKIRCGWCENHPLDRLYHDQEWGVPEHDDQKLFELLILEGMQAGLSWSTVLAKREYMRIAFDQFNPHLIKDYNQDKIQSLLNDPGVIRNRLKINGLILNAKAFLQVQEEFGSFNQYIWSFVNHQPIINRWKSLSEVPASTPLSEKISKDLKKRGFKFVGPTIIYAYMQAIGIVNDHLEDCYRYQALCQS